MLDNMFMINQKIVRENAKNLQNHVLFEVAVMGDNQFSTNISLSWRKFFRSVFFKSDDPSLVIPQETAFHMIFPVKICCVKRPQLSETAKISIRLDFRMPSCLTSSRKIQSRKRGQLGVRLIKFIRINPWLPKINPLKNIKIYISSMFSK